MLKSSLVTALLCLSIGVSASSTVYSLDKRQFFKLVIDRAVPSQCTSQCSAAQSATTTCQNDTCFCTTTNIGNLRSCFQCIVDAGGNLQTEQNTLSKTVQDCQTQGFSVPNPAALTAAAPSPASSTASRPTPPRPTATSPGGSSAAGGGGGSGSSSGGSGSGGSGGSITSSVSVSLTPGPGPISTSSLPANSSVPLSSLSSGGPTSSAPPAATSSSAAGGNVIPSSWTVSAVGILFGVVHRFL